MINAAFGDFKPSHKAKSLGIGIENIKARLEIYYGTRASLSTKQGEEGEFTATIKIGDDYD